MYFSLQHEPRSPLSAGLPLRTIAFWLSLLLLFLVPWEDAFTIEGLGSVARIGGLLVGGIWIAAVLTSGRLRRLQAFHFVVLLFVGWNALSFFWSAGPIRTVDRVMTYAQLLLLLLIVWDLFREVPAIRMGMQAYVLGCYVSTVSVVVNYLNNDVYTRMSAADRFSGAGFGPNGLGIILVVGIPMAWFLFHNENDGGVSSPLIRFMNLVYVPAAAVAVLLTGSRTAGLALLVAVAYILVTLLKARVSMVVAALVAAVAVGLVVPLLPDATLDRVANTGSDLASGSLSGRVDLWNESWQIFKDHPLTGVGSGGFSASAVHSGQTVVHNVFLGILAESGLIGLSLFCVMLGLVGRSALRQPREKSWMWLTVLAVWFVGSMSLSLEARKVTWLVFALIGVSEWATARNETLHQRDPRDLGAAKQQESSFFTS